MNVFRGLGRVLFFPLFEVYQITHSSRPLFVRILLGVLTGLGSSFLWALSVISIGFLTYRLSIPVLQQLGIVQVPISIAGTGSMYPTFPKGTSGDETTRENEVVASPLMQRYPQGLKVFGRAYFTRAIRHGDIVSFKNPQTDNILAQQASPSANIGGFVKRIIGLPGDDILLRDGYVYVNGQPLNEPYTAAPRSTFGGETLADCQVLHIPDGQAFVLGDNRKASDDSRFTLGLIALTDIEYVLPWEKQAPTYTLHWRDTAQDSAAAGHPELKPTQFLALLNEFRQQNQRKPLRLEPKLSQSANIRAKVILQYDDLSFEASRSGITMSKAMQQAGYANIVYGEAPVLGYYTAAELMQYFQTQPRWQSFLLNPEYQDAGIASVVGNLQNCPTEILVLHLAGYKPPEYSADMVQSWQHALENIHRALPSWLQTRTYGPTYEARKDQYERMITVMQARQSIIAQITDRLVKKQWLTDQEKTLIEKDKVLATEESSLAQTLNQNP